MRHPSVADKRRSKRVLAAADRTTKRIDDQLDRLQRILKLYRERLEAGLAE